MKETTANIQDIAEVKTGFPLREGVVAAKTGNARLVQMRGVHIDRGIDWSLTVPIDTEGRRAPDWLQNNDVLFVGRGARFFSIIVKNPPSNALAAPHFHVVRIKRSGIILPEFLSWALNNRDAQKYYAANQEGSALPYISRKILSALSIKLPDIRRQEAIVNAYACWQRQRQLMEELTTLKQTLVDNILEQSI